MLPEVMEAVAGRRFPCEPAALAGHRRRQVRGEVFPAAFAAPGETLEGVLWRGLDAAALARIDRFEGELYERPALPVALAGGGRATAFVYLLRAEHRALASDAPWSEAEFRARHLSAYLAGCRAFAREAGGTV
jgi:hypothetical protein